MSSIFLPSSDDESAALDNIRQQLVAAPRRPKPAKKALARDSSDDDSSLSSSSCSLSDESEQGTKKKLAVAVAATKIRSLPSRVAQLSRPTLEAPNVGQSDQTTSDNCPLALSKRPPRNPYAKAAGTRKAPSVQPLAAWKAPLPKQASTVIAARGSVAATTIVESPNTDSDDDFPFLDPTALQAMDQRVQQQQQTTQEQSRFFSPTQSTVASSPSPTMPTTKEDYCSTMHIGMTKQNLLYTAAAAATASKSPMSLPGMTFVPPTKPLDEAPKKAAPVQHENQSQHLFDNVPESFETLPVAAAAAMLDSQDDYTRSGQSAPKAVIMTQETQASRRWEPASDDYAKPKDDTVHSTWNTVTDSRQDDSDYHQHHQHQVLETTKIDFDERIPEIHCSLCVPPPHQPTPEPMAHYYSPTNRPINVRRKTPVSQVFDAPINSLWKNKFGTFNQLQSEIANTLAYSDDNVVVSAPTGAGKTAVFEMAMARFFQVDLQHNNGGGVNNNNRGPRRMQISKQRKIVYVSPSKALCEERFEDWSTRTTAMQLGIEVALITGDGDPGEAFRDLASAHLILTTPEKWDSLTRKWTENFFLFGCVKLFLIDEVHLLADSGRGCCLESVVCRMKGIQRVSRKVQVTPADIETCSYTGTSPDAINSTMRIVAVSATLPNITEIAAFLDANEAHTFDESYRPVPLTLHVVGQGFLGDKSSNHFHFWSRLERDVPNIIHRFSKGRPTIIFCHSKAETERLADILATANGIGSGPVNSDIACQSRVQKMQRVLIQGIAYHHAGLELDDRRMIERAFIGGKIRALCATSTLAMGVNLPAHLVVIKGTKAWRGGNGYEDLDQASLLQMIGRAGRPGFDTSGTAVIMTDNASKARYEKLASSGLEPAKSKLLSKLVEVVNTEISQLVITSVETALNWIKGTLFFVQLNENPQAFGLQSASPQAIDSHLLQLFGETLRRLQTLGAKVLEGGHEIIPVPANNIMSQQLVTYEAMELFVGLPFDASQCQILQALTEIADIHRPVRRSEKKVLNETHKMIKYKLPGPPSKVRVQKPPEKAFVLLQAGIGQIYLEDYAMRQEMSSMVDYSSRMLVAVEEYSVRGSMHGRVAVQSLKLRRSLATSLWSAGEGALNQLVGVGQTTTASLKFNGITTFEDVLASTEGEIEKAAQRIAPFGVKLRSAVSKILQRTLKVSGEIEFTPGCSTPKAIICRLGLRKDVPLLGSGSDDRKGSAAVVTYTLIVHTDRPGGCLVYQKNVSCPGTYKVASPTEFGKITMQLVASMVGLDEKVELDGNAEIASSTFAGKALSGKAASQRKVRGPNQKAQSGISSHFRKTTRSTEDPRMGRATTGKQNAPNRLSSLNNSKSITPSPKPPQTTDAQAISGNGASLVRDSTQSTLASFARTAPSHRVVAPYATHPMGQYESQPPAFQGEASSEPHANKRHYDSHRMSQPGQSMQGPSWKQAKREQQRSQQRAFAKKQDNPFSLYKHDPNDAESFLDALSSRNAGLSPQSSVIPSEGLRALSKVYETPRHFQQQARTANRRHEPASGSWLCGRRPAPEGRVSSRELLAQKAAVCNKNASMMSFDATRPMMSPYTEQGYRAGHSQAFEQPGRSQTFAQPGRTNHHYDVQMQHQTHTVMPMNHVDNIGVHMQQQTHAVMPMHRGMPAYADEWPGMEAGFSGHHNSAIATQGFPDHSLRFRGMMSPQYTSEGNQGRAAFSQMANEQNRTAPEGSHRNYHDPKQYTDHSSKNASTGGHAYEAVQLCAGDSRGETTWTQGPMNGSGAWGGRASYEHQQVPYGQESLENTYGMGQQDLEATFF